MSSQKVKIGKYTANDPTPYCVFKNMTYVFRKGEQILDVKPYCDDFEVRSVDPEDFRMTTFLRQHASKLGRFFNMAKLYQQPMYTYEDGASLLLPRDNTLGLDYLTYRHPVYKELIIFLVDELVSSGDVGAEKAARILLTDYSMSAPYASIMRRDGRLKVDEKIWPTSALDFFKRTLSNVFTKTRAEACGSIKKFLPVKNASKSVGFFDIFPDGSRMRKGNNLYLPEKLYGGVSPLENLWARKNNFPIKQAWIKTGSLEKNFEWFLENCDRYEDPNIYLTAFMRCCCSVHTEAYRTNNADETLNDLTKGARHAINEGLFKKNRIVSYENSDYSISSGSLRDQEYFRKLRSVNKGAWGTGLKKRPMFPGPNASFSTPLILLCRMLLGPLEERSSGFPSNRPNVLKRYSNYFLNHLNSGQVICTFDRKNSEQFITDNIENVLKMLPGSLRDVINAALCSVVCSKYGPRFTKALLSGTALTTFLNSVVGLFEMCCFVSSATFGEKWRDKLNEVIQKVIFSLVDETECEFEKFAWLINLGTDDQIAYVSVDGVNHDELLKKINSNLTKARYQEGRSLTVDIGCNATVFGLDFKIGQVDVSKTLGLAKIFLFEKENLGDSIAVKYDARFSLLEDYVPLFKDAFKKFGLGSIQDYGEGSRNYFKNLAYFGFSGYQDLWNIYSPSDKIIMSSYLTQSGFDISKFTDKYSLEEVEPFVKLINNIKL